MNQISDAITNSRGIVCHFREEYAFLSNFYNCEINDFE